MAQTLTDPNAGDFRMSGVSLESLFQCECALNHVVVLGAADTDKDVYVPADLSRFYILEQRRLQRHWGASDQESVECFRVSYQNIGGEEATQAKSSTARSGSTG